MGITLACVLYETSDWLKPLSHNQVNGFPFVQQTIFFLSMKTYM